MIEILLFAFALDVLLGEPPEKVHPVVWMGKFIERVDKKVKRGHPLSDKIKGGILTITCIVLFSLPVYILLEHLSTPLQIVIGAFILKTTFSYAYLIEVAKNVKDSLGNIEVARSYLKGLVSRDVSSLDEREVIGATIESLAENTCDSIIAPLFYFSIFGVAGAIAYRVVNTADAMIGYKDEKHIDFGYFSAKLDDLLNFIPARISGALIAIVGGGFKIMIRDARKTESPNAGWSMSAMAGSLGIRLEKKGCYVLGEEIEDLTPEKVEEAIKIVKIVSLLGLGIFSAILMASYEILRFLSYGQVYNPLY
ncbi:MAG: cobalamin biosynthesis protein [Candidatus Syntropharchaeia archaeon]